jgi:hypothetical protein
MRIGVQGQQGRGLRLWILICLDRSLARTDRPETSQEKAYARTKKKVSGYRRSNVAGRFWAGLGRNADMVMREHHREQW